MYSGMTTMNRMATNETSPPNSQKDIDLHIAALIPLRDKQQSEAPTTIAEPNQIGG